MINTDWDMRLIPPSCWRGLGTLSMTYTVVFVLVVVTKSGVGINDQTRTALNVVDGVQSADENEDTTETSSTYLSLVCLARCLTRCVDTANGRPPTEWNMTEQLLPEVKPIETMLKTNSTYCQLYYCSAYMSDKWMSVCNGSGDCLSTCAYFNIQSEGDEYLPPHPVTDITVKKQQPYTMTLTWEGITEKDYAILYIIVYHTEGVQNSTYIHLMKNTSMIINMTSCGSYDIYVVAINQFGASNTTSLISAQVHPGPVIYIKENLEYNTTRSTGLGYFKYSMMFRVPPGWDPGEISHYEVYEPILPYCSNSALPPYPLPPIVSRVPGLDGLYILSIVVDDSAFGCIYHTKVTAVSNCGFRGVVQNVTMNFTSCDTIDYFPCPTPSYEPPGYVNNLTVVTEPGSLKVNVSWQAPEETGSHGIAAYVIQWGPVISEYPFPILGDEHIFKVPQNVTMVVLEVPEFNQIYGAKVAALDYVNMDFVNETLNMLQPSVIFTVQNIEFTTTGSPNTSTTEKMEYNNPGDMNPLLAVYVLLPVSVILLAAIFIILYFKRRQKHKQSSQMSGGSSVSGLVRNKIHRWMVNNPFYAQSNSSMEHSSDDWEIRPEYLTLGEVLGSGAFGQVLLGVLNSAGLKGQRTDNDESPGTQQYVAVKMLHEFASDTQKQEFLQEMALMKQIGPHPNIISIVGCCTQREPLCLVVEHAQYGDLLHYLRKYRHLIIETQSCDSGITNPSDQITYHDILSFARQIAVGMEFLSQRGFVHRDLATRNVMVADHKVIKIGDFGLTRYVYTNKLYVAGKGSRLPVKWMAIEAIEEYHFTSETDVWSYGVLLFEMVTLGSTPYPTIPNKSLLKHLKRGYRLEKPDSCTPELYELMRDCWQSCPGDRPSFTDVRQRLESIIEALSPAHYLMLCPDPDLYQYHSSTESSTTSDPEADDVFTAKCSRSFMGSLRRDSGMGEKSSTGTSQVTLRSSTTRDDGIPSPDWASSELIPGHQTSVPRSAAAVSVSVTSSDWAVAGAANDVVSVSPASRLDSGFSSSLPILLDLSERTTDWSSELSTGSRSLLITSTSRPDVMDNASS